MDAVEMRLIPASRQFDLEGAAVMGRAEQYRLLLERRADFAIAQHLLDDVARLVGFVANGDELRTLSRDAFGPEVLGEPLARQLDHAIGSRKDRLRRAVIAIECDDVRGRTKGAREVEDVANCRGAERIDRLSVIAHHGKTTASGLQ